MSNKPIPMSLESLQQMLQDDVFAGYVQTQGLRVIEVHDNEVALALPLLPHLVHVGGVVCGQALMAAADSAMVLAISHQLGGFRPMTTVQLQISFLRPIAGPGPGPGPGPLPGSPAEARIVARVLRAGKNLVFGEIEALDSAGRLAAHSTATYALL